MRLYEKAGWAERIQPNSNTCSPHGPLLPSCPSQISPSQEKQSPAKPRWRHGGRRWGHWGRWCSNCTGAPGRCIHADLQDTGPTTPWMCALEGCRRQTPNLSLEHCPPAPLSPAPNLTQLLCPNLLPLGTHCGIQSHCLPSLAGTCSWNSRGSRGRRYGHHSYVIQAHIRPHLRGQGPSYSRGRTERGTQHPHKARAL